VNVALLVIGAFLLLSICLGLLARRGREMSLEQWTVGGRGFGTIFVFLLMAGEIYTTFTFLGASGWAYGKGAPTFYILCYGTLAYSMSYFLLPAIWRYAKEHGLVSQADFFELKYDSPTLGVLVSLVSVAALVPYLVLQLRGLGIIVSEASYGSISPAAAVWIGMIIVVVYVVVSGIHGSAWTAVVKDIMILAVAVTLGVYLPVHYYGGLGPMFAAIEAAKPGFLVLPGRGQSPSWFISTVALTTLGFYMWPQYFASAYTARGEEVFRRNAVILPLYQLVMLFVFFVGFASILQVPGLQGTDADLSLLRVTKATFAPWAVGVVGAAGVLTALVPGSLILNAAATILAKNVIAGGARRARLSDARIAMLARALVPVVALVAIWFTFRGGATIVALLLIAYSMVTQLFPALLASLARARWVTTPGAIAGIIAGEFAVACLTFTKATMATLFPGWPGVLTDLNVGIVALVVNVAVMFLVSAVRVGQSTRHPVIESTGR
jgi:solute:Na+ symporter, SSS family